MKVNDGSFPLEGFELIPGGLGGFNGLSGPFYMKVTEEGAVVAFRVETRHLNHAGSCHGAALAALADNVGAPLIRQLKLDNDLITPTINLAIDYLAPAALGDWVELQAVLLRRTKTLLFCHGLLCANGTVIARTNATYMITPRRISQVTNRGG